MLKNIHPLLSPDLLAALARMGHGDTIAIVDRNYPAYAAGPLVVRADGSDTTEIAEAILTVLPIDTFIDHPVARMQMVGDSERVPEVQSDFLAVAEAAESRSLSFETIERFAFYERARSATVIIATGERRSYGCFIVTKGVIGGEQNKHSALA